MTTPMRSSSSATGAKDIITFIFEILQGCAPSKVYKLFVHNAEEAAKAISEFLPFPDEVHVVQ